MLRHVGDVWAYRYYQAQCAGIK